MRTLPAGMQDHLDSRTTTLCHCWRLTPRNGGAMGFTDHDRTLTFDGTTFEADAGFDASAVQSSLGLTVDNLDAAGALSSARLSEERILAGDFDNAAIELWRVNWQDVSQRVLMRKGNLGEVTRGAGAFTAELRGIAHYLNQAEGRLYRYGCDAVLGDARCGVNADATAFSVTGVVAASSENRRLTVTGAESFAEDWFARGVAAFTSGANTGRSAVVKHHRIEAGAAVIELWQPMGMAVVPGDQVKLTAGCDKQFSTCRVKFANAANFRGFPHIPGDDFVLNYARRGDPANDGQSLSA